ncbi:hypothetical protein pb186bvf_014109 [Paramecium bursaria]
MIYDVVIVGAGPVGLTLAGALQKSNLLQKILIIDHQKKPQIQFQQIPNQRVISINKSSKSIFESINAWDNFDISRINQFNEMVVKDQGQVLNFKNQESYIIEYDNIVNALAKSISVEMKYEYKLKSIESKEGEYLKINDQFYTKLLVGSDGNKSQVKELSRIGTYGKNYNQMGLVCTVERENQNNNVAYQYYLRNGNPLAILPLPNPYSSIVWTLGLDDYKFALSLSDEQFLNQLNQHTDGFKINKICNARLGFPLQNLQAFRYVKERIALIGDAAHSMHPMAGLGMNMGISDAALLANNIIQNIKTGNDIGQETSLAPYESKAKVMNYSTSLGVEAVKQLYSTDSIKHLRKVGAQILNQADYIKNLLIQGASSHPLGPKNYEWV